MVLVLALKRKLIGWVKFGWETEPDQQVMAQNLNLCWMNVQIIDPLKKSQMLRIH